MKQGRRIVLISAAVVLVMAVVLILWPRQVEPEYQGKPLSYWFCPGYLIGFAEVREAVEHCGTNAIPWMLKGLAYKPSAARLKFERWRGKWPKAIRDNSWVRRILPQAAQVSVPWRISVVFDAVGSNAVLAVPKLTEMACAGNPYALETLMELRVYGVPGLIQVLDRGERTGRANVLRHIGYAPWFRTNGVFVAAALRHVSDPDAEVACAAAQLVADSHIDASTAVPALIGGLKHAHPTARRMCSYALSAYGADARESLPALRNLLLDPDASVRQDATNAISLIEP